MDNQVPKEKYLLFAGNCYYAQGGADDFRGFFDSIESAVKAYAILAITIADGGTIDQWAHITNSKIEKIVECYYRESSDEHPRWDAV